MNMHNTTGALELFAVKNREKSQIKQKAFFNLIFKQLPQRFCQPHLLLP